MGCIKTDIYDFVLVAVMSELTLRCLTGFSSCFRSWSCIFSCRSASLRTIGSKCPERITPSVQEVRQKSDIDRQNYAGQYGDHICSDGMHCCSFALTRCIAVQKASARTCTCTHTSAFQHAFLSILSVPFVLTATSTWTYAEYQRLTMASTLRALPRARSTAAR